MQPVEAFGLPLLAELEPARILQKLKLRDRVQVVVLAYESGLVQPGSG